MKLIESSSLIDLVKNLNTVKLSVQCEISTRYNLSTKVKEKFTLFKDFYCIGDCTFFDSFLSLIESLKITSQENMINITIWDLNKLLIDQYDSMRFTSNVIGAGGNVNCSVEWPLTIIFPNFDRYNAIMFKLLDIKKCIIELNNQIVSTRKCIGVKAKMVHFITCFYSYIQTDVIETLFGKLMNIESNDLQVLKREHDFVLETIEDCLFIKQDLKHLDKLLTGVLTQSNLFCQNTDVFNDLIFDELCGKIYRSFAGARGGKQKYLELFLTRLDFSRWFSISSV